MKDSNPLKAVIKNLILFSAVFALILSAINVYLDRVTFWPCESKYNEIKHPKESPDMIILGDSSAETGVNPAFVESGNFSVYNFAIGGSSPSFFLDFYERLLRPYYKKPKVVLYCYNWVLFAHKKMFEQDSEYFSNAVFLKALFDPHLNKKILILNRFPCIKYRNELISHLFKIDVKSLSVIDDPLSKGFRARIQPDWPPLNTIRPLDPGTESEQAEQLRCFRALIDRFLADGISVVLVNLPSYEPALTGPDKELRIKYARLVDGIAKEKNVLHLDYNQSLYLNPGSAMSIFNNATHLNTYGAELFTKTLRQGLKGDARIAQYFQ